jgi:hypothetical protein
VHACVRACVRARVKRVGARLSVCAKSPIRVHTHARTWTRSPRAMHGAPPPRAPPSTRRRRQEARARRSVCTRPCTGSSPAVDADGDLSLAEEKLLEAAAAARLHDAADGRRRAAAHEVEVEHALHGGCASVCEPYTGAHAHAHAHAWTRSPRAMHGPATTSPTPHEEATTGGASTPHACTRPRMHGPHLHGEGERVCR